MSSGFAKLDSGIVDSTLWMQPHDVLRVWIAMLAKCDSYGIVRASIPAMAHLCLMTTTRFEEIIAAFTAPDSYSRTSEDDGRRLRVVEGGWVIINYVKYRELVQTKPQSHAERQRKYRDRLSERDRRTTGDAKVTEAVTRDAEAEAEAEAETAKPEQKHSTAASRGARISSDFKPSEKSLSWAKHKRPDLDLGEITEAFVDYWEAEAGAHARKTDWQKTWKNWVRRQAKNGSSGSTQRRKLSAVERVEQACEADRQREDAARFTLSADG